MTAFERLRAIIEADDALAAELLAHQDVATFCAEVVRIGERFGLSVSEGEIQEAIARGRSAWYATWAPA